MDKKYKFLKLSIILCFTCVLILFTTKSCQVKNPNNFTLIGAGYSGMYGDFSDLYKEKEALQIVAKKWDIKLESVGCSISNKVIADMKENNREARRNLKKKYGSDWLDKFKNEVHLEHKQLLAKQKNL